MRLRIPSLVSDGAAVYRFHFYYILFFFILLFVHLLIVYLFPCRRLDK